MSPAYKALAIVLLAGALAGGGYRAGVGREHDRRLAEVAEIRRGHVDTLRGIAALAATAAEKTAALQQTWAGALAAIEIRRTKEHTDALAENARLVGAVATGERRLRIQGACRPAGGGDLSQAAGAARLDDGTAVELDRAAGQAVLDLRAALIADRAALSGLQDYVRMVCGLLPPSSGRDY